jgi:hypothetical protein
MINIRNYIRLSTTAETIKEIFIESSEFSEKYRRIYTNEQKAFLRHFVVNNVPYAFRDYPILYERITQYLADKLEICVPDIKLIGSAKTGFSMSPPPAFGISFGNHSDLDFSIINEELLYSIKSEFQNWVGLFKTKQILPKNSTEENYWLQNLETGDHQIKRGMFDTHLIPNYDQFPKTKTINNCLFLIKINLDNIYRVKVKKATARVYKSWTTFEGQINLNNSLIMKKIQNVA